MKNSTKFLLGLVATTSFLAVGCGDDVPESKCDPACTDGQICNEDTGKCEEKASKCDPACTTGQICNEETGKCEEKSDSKCDPACTDGQVCNEETGKCEESSIDVKCDNGEIPCDGICVNIQINTDHCGSCGTKCDDGFQCDNGQCIDPNASAKECEVDEPATCEEGNVAKTCKDNKWVLTECGEQVCSDGICMEKDVTKECDVEVAAVCDGNVVKSCVDGKWNLTDCGNKKCDSGACSDEEFKAECEDDMTPTCDDNNNIKACSSQMFTYQPCGSLTCVEGKCEVIKIAECDASFVPVCEENGIKKCLDGSFVVEPCEGSKYCKEAECVNASIEDLCPDDEKVGPGVCGCGIDDVDLDNNGTIDCLEVGDLCPDDVDKTLPGICGCGIPDTFNDHSGNPVCLESGKDLCPSDETKTMPGLCGCNVPDTIDAFTHEPLCGGISIIKTPYDMCLNNDAKYALGTCGCSAVDEIDATSGVPSCVLADEAQDLCTTDDAKTRPGVCGCGVEDSEDNLKDSDGDGLSDCLDQCPNNPYKFILDSCDCSKIRVRIDGIEYCATPISTVEEFIELRNNINSNTNVNNDPVFNTVNDVYAIMNDLNLLDAMPSGVANGWIGFNNFKGKMTSTGKTISFRKKDNTLGVLNCTTSNCGLFNSLSGARIHNINVEMNINTTGGNAGIVAGSVASSTLSSMNVKGDVVGKGNYVGGVIGNATATHISDVTQEGKVTNTGTCTGGVIGALTGGGSLTSIDSVGDVTGAAHTGGLFGRVYAAPITNVSNEGKTITNTRDLGTGGIVGYANNGVDIDHAVSKGSIEGRQYVGGIAGHGNGAYKNCINYADITVDGAGISGNRAYTGGIVGRSVIGDCEHLKNHGKIHVTCSEATAETHSWNCTNVAGLFGASPAAGYDKYITVNDLENTGDIYSEKGSQVGGIIGSGYIYMKNVRNSGKISGHHDTGGITGLCSRTMGYDATKYKWENIVFENIENTGEVNSVGSHVGGIIGRFESTFEKENLQFNNIINTGNVKTTSDRAGGFIGVFRHNNVVTFTDVYSTGNVEGNAYIGGLMGDFAENTIECNGNIIPTSSDHTYSATFDRVYATGSVTASSSLAGGLIGVLNLTPYARTAKTSTVYCPSDNNKSTQQTVYNYYKATKTTTIRNAYAAGDVLGTSGVGGLIGLVSGSSYNSNFTSTIYNYDAGCNLTSTQQPAGKVDRAGKLIIANTYASGKVTGTGTQTGGFIGRYSYTNSLNNAAYNHLFNNTYATGLVSPSTAGAYMGETPKNTTVLNSYYWVDAGTTKMAPTTIPGILAFQYESAIPMVTEYQVSLLDTLNSNITASSAPELKNTNSSKWIEIEKVLMNNLKFKIPSFDIKPIEWKIEEEIRE